MSLTIRRAGPKDAAAMTGHMSDPAVFGGLLQLPYPTEEMWLARLTEVSAGGKTDLLLIAERDGDMLGTAGLGAQASARRRHAMTVGISVSPAAQGQGVGTALMTALCDHADNWLAVWRLELTVYTDNAVALRLYRKFGFEIEGTFKGYAFRDGRYVDAHSMARLRPPPA